MAIKAPEFVQEAETAWNTSTTPKETAAKAVKPGDVLVSAAGAEGELTSVIPTATGIEFTQRQVITGAGNRSFANGYTASVASENGSLKVKLTRSGNASNWWGGNVLTFRNSDGIGETAKAENDGSVAVSFTTKADNSAVVVILTDWNASDGSSRTWRTVNGFTPTEANGKEFTYFRDSSHYTVFGAYYPDVGAAGAKEIGLTAPTGVRYSLIAIEVKGSEEEAETKTEVELPVATETDAAEEVVTQATISVELPVATEADEGLRALLKGEAIRQGFPFPFSEEETVEEAAATEIELPIATETGSALNLSLARLLSLVAASETDSLVAPGLQRLLALTSATETDSAVALGVGAPLELPIATESDTALNLTANKLVELLSATETDSGQGLTHSKIINSLSVATESDLSREVEEVPDEVGGEFLQFFLSRRNKIKNQ